MKAIACADLHLDKNRRFEDTKDVLRQIVTYAIENDVEQVWILGDIYDRRRPFNSEKVLFHKFVKSLADKGIVVQILPGNHDSGADTVSAVDEFGVLDLENVNLLSNPTVLTVDNHSIYLGHFLVNGSKLGSSDYLASNAIGLEKVLETKADLYLLGDVHKPQVLHSRPDVLYVGSVEQINFGERKEAKGFVLVETSVNDINPRYTFVPVKNRPMIQHDVTYVELQENRDYECPEGIIKMKITCTKDEYKEINEDDIRNKLKSAYSLTIEYDIIREDRVRHSDISEGCSYEDAFIKYSEVAELDEETIKLGLDIINDN